MSGLPGKGRGSGGNDGEENKRRGAQDKNKAPAKPQPKRILTVEQRAALNQRRRKNDQEKKATAEATEAGRQERHGEKEKLNRERKQQRLDAAEQAKHNPELAVELRKQKDEKNVKERAQRAQKRIVDQERAKHDPDLKTKLLEKANHQAAYQRNWKEQRKIKETALASGRPETPASITWEKPETLLSYGSPQPKLLNSKKMDIQFEEYDPQNPEGSDPKVPRVTKPRTEKPREPLNSNRMDIQFQEYDPQNPEASDLKVPRVTKPRPQKSRPQNPKRSDTKVPRVAEPRPLPSSSYGYDDSQTGYAMQPPTNVGRGEQRPSFAAVNTDNEQFLASLDTRRDQTRTGWRPGPAPANLPSLDQRRENPGRRPRPTGSDLNTAVTLSMGNLSMLSPSSPPTVSPRRLRNSPPDNPDDRATQRPTNEQIKAKMDMKKFLG